MSTFAIMKEEEILANRRYGKEVMVNSFRIYLIFKQVLHIL